MRGTAVFLCRYFRQPKRIGAIAPSSRFLARRMTEWLEWDTASAVVEYGPGLGSFTKQILAEKPPSSKFFAVELDTDMADRLRIQFPNVKIYNESVTEIERLCKQEEIEQVDAVVSGLPWAAFGDDLQSAILDSMLKVLKPGGQFVTFAYLQGLMLPAGQRFKNKLKTHFSEVERSRVVWFNLPPAFVYRCRK